MKVAAAEEGIKQAAEVRRGTIMDSLEHKMPVFQQNTNDLVESMKLYLLDSV